MLTIRTFLNTRTFSLVLTALTLYLIIRSGTFLLIDCTVLPNIWSGWFVVAAAAAILYRVINAMGWSIVLEAMGYSVDRMHATQIWLRAESRRWLPGGVWGYASRAVQAHQLGVSKSAASASMLVELILTFAASLIVLLPCLFLYRSEVSDLVAEAALSWPLMGAVLILFCGLGLGAYRSRSFRRKLALAAE